MALLLGEFIESPFLGCSFLGVLFLVKERSKAPIQLMLYERK
jgi:hypothetical protein